MCKVRSPLFRLGWSRSRLSSSSRSASSSEEESGTEGTSSTMSACRTVHTSHKAVRRPSWSIRGRKSS